MPIRPGSIKDDDKSWLQWYWLEFQDWLRLNGLTLAAWLAAIGLLLMAGLKLWEIWHG
jgi:hypothetical protein